MLQIPFLRRFACSDSNCIAVGFSHRKVSAITRRERAPGSVSASLCSHKALFQLHRYGLGIPLFAVKTGCDLFLQCQCPGRITLPSQLPRQFVQFRPRQPSFFIQRTDETHHPRLFLGRQMLDFINDFHRIHNAKLPWRRFADKCGMIPCPLLEGLSKRRRFGTGRK